MKAIKPYYFEETASLLNGALALLERCGANEADSDMASVSAIVEIAKARLTDEKLNGLIEWLEKNQDN